MKISQKIFARLYVCVNIKSNNNSFPTRKGDTHGDQEEKSQKEKIRFSQGIYK
jgi:hypothetical protein